MRSQLRTLSKDAADGVARHLIAAGRLVDEDPQAALQHARAARVIGARVAVVREAVGETAYAAGEWAEAIAELRTARRMTGDDAALPMIADSERALGRADRALRLAQSEEAQALEPAARAEMRIVEAGARSDLGQLDAALLTLEDAGLDRKTVQPWSARVWYAYADLLLAAGREDEAREWFVAAVAVDPDGATDADERLLQLDGIEILDDEDDLDDENSGSGENSETGVGSQSGVDGGAGEDEGSGVDGGTGADGGIGGYGGIGDGGLEDELVRDASDELSTAPGGGTGSAAGQPMGDISASCAAAEPSVSIEVAELDEAGEPGGNDVGEAAETNGTADDAIDEADEVSASAETGESQEVDAAAETSEPSDAETGGSGGDPGRPIVVTFSDRTEE